MSGMQGELLQQASKRVGQLISRDEITSDLDQYSEEVIQDNVIILLCCA
jgi:hypothetical protein